MAKSAKSNPKAFFGYKNGRVSVGPLKNGESGKYRPFSLTCMACKIMESLVKDVIADHLHSNNLMFSAQHGFMKKCSCLTNFVEYIETLNDLVDKNLDFSKAFVKVLHRRLGEVLRAHGINGNVLNWVMNWITSREQRVILIGEASEWLPVDLGVPKDRS